MTTHRFLQTVAAAFLLFIASVFFSTDAQARPAYSSHCTCTSTITTGSDVQCCILKSAFGVICGDGNTYAAFPSAGPTETICHGESAEFPCPCPDGTGGIQALVFDGHTIFPGTSPSFLYTSNCCLRISVTFNASGCLNITISVGSCSCDCQNQISLSPSMTCCLSLADIRINCNDGTSSPAFPSAGTGDQICANQTFQFACPCSSGLSSIEIGGAIIPIGSTTTITYGGCCMNVTVLQDASGCVDIEISPCCGCTNSISLTEAVSCCIHKSDISMHCSDGTTTPAFPSAAPAEMICGGSGLVSFSCHCSGSVDGIFIGGTTIPAGSAGDLMYGDCCLHVEVTQRADGCIDVNVSPGTLCDLEKEQPHLMGASSSSGNGASAALAGAR